MLLRLRWDRKVKGGEDNECVSVREEQEKEVLCVRRKPVVLIFNPQPDSPSLFISVSNNVMPDVQLLCL